MKRFVELARTCTATAIMDIPEGEPESETLDRILKYLESRGGAANVIHITEAVSFRKLPGIPEKEEAEWYGVIE